MLASLRSHRFCLPLALLLAVGAQYGFTGEFFTRNLNSNYYIWGISQWVGCVLLLAAVMLCAWARVPAVWRQNAVPAAGTADDNSPPLPSRGRRAVVPFGFSALAIVAALMFYLASLVLFWTVGENALVRFLWLGGVTLLVAGCALPSWQRRRLLTRRMRLSQSDSLEWLAVALITFAGFLLRYWRLTELPAHVDDDVSLMGWFSLEMLRGGDDRWFGMSGSQHPFSCNQILAWSMRLFGQDHYGLVMGSVLAGTLTLPFVYLLGRELFGRRAGFVAAALLAGSYTHIHFSRILFGPLPTLLLTVGFYSLFRGLRNRRALPFALAGVALGFALLSYDSARVGPVIVLALFLSSFFWRGGNDNGEEAAGLRRPTARQWALLATGALLAFGPMLAFAVRDFFRFHGRGNDVVLWNPVIWKHTTAKYGTTNFFGVLAEQLKHTLLALHYYGDASPHCALEKPMVSALGAALGALGAGLALRRWRDPRCFLPLVWVALTFFLGGVLTSDPPYWPHLNIALPAIMLLAALAAERLGEALFRVEHSRSGALVYGVALAAVLTWSAAHNWKIYNGFAKRYAGPRVRTARYLQSLPAGCRVFIVDPVIDWNVYSFRFLNRHVRGTSLPPARLFEAAPELDGAPTVFIVYRQPELLAFVRQHYYGGGDGAGNTLLKERAHRDHDGNVAFTSFEVNVPSRPRLTNWSWRDELTRLVRAPGWWLIAALLSVASLTLLWLHRTRPRPLAVVESCR